jgi:hypothetical protein
MSLTQKHIPAVISNVNRYLKRKNLPRQLDDFWITRISQKKLNDVWDVTSQWQKDVSIQVFSDIESGSFSLVDFATYVALYSINENDFYVGKYSKDTKKKIKNIVKLFSKDLYIENIGKIEAIIKDAKIKPSDITKVNISGTSLVYDLLMNGEISMVLAVEMEPHIHSSKHETEEHKKFRARLKLLRAIRNNK